MDFTLLLILATFISGLFLLLMKVNNENIKNFELINFIASLFPILFFVLVIRSFIVEPYRIPSGSMIPTLLVGDFILVKKYEYGLKLPLTNYMLIKNENPKYGDVIVFQYPQDKSINYIKRVIALPGDSIEYINKEIFVNGKKYQHALISDNYIFKDELSNNMLFNENNGIKQYKIAKNPEPDQNFTYVVPKDTYFVLGDNRDNSNDSRYWGPVPKQNLIGKAFMIWMYWNPNSVYSAFDRIGLPID
jgi:signal peptidase I